MKTRLFFIALALLALSTLNSQLSNAHAQGTAFTYQGQLQNNGNPANGLYDVRFMVWDAPTNGNLIAGPLTNSATGVSNGLFAVTLDFGIGVFTGPARWLELDVRTNGGNAFTTLLPLQPLLPMPYAIMANTASNLIGTLPSAQLTGALPATQLSGTVSLSQLPLSIVTNNSTGLVLNGAFSGNGAGLTNLTLLSGGQPIYMNFDSVNPGAGIDATAYLASFGITLSSVSQPSSVYIVADTNYYGSGSVTASSPHNFLLQSVSAPSCSYTLNFSAPLQSVTFTRITISASLATPQWTATAYAGANAVGSVGVCCIDSDQGQPAQTYTISGHGITSLTISGVGLGFTALASAPLDDFYMVPETFNVNGAVAAISFSGNGSGLTNLNASQLTGGTVPLAQLPPALVTNNSTGINLSGTFSGDGSGLASLNASQLTSGAVPSEVLTSVPAANLTGTFPQALLPTVVVTNQEPGVTLSGTFSGNGSGLTGLTTPTIANYVDSYSTTTQIVATASTFQDITNHVDPQISGWTHTSGTTSFICAQSGLYLVQYTAEAITSATATTTVSIRAVDNGTEIPDSQSTAVANTASQTVPISKSFIASFNSGDVLQFQFTGSSTDDRLVSNFGLGTTRPSFSCTLIRIQ